MNPKGDLLQQFLEERGARLHSRAGWQKISCINKDGHPRGDRNPSASVDLTKGRYRCFACDLHGDAYALLMQLEGVDFRTAYATLGGGEGRAVAKVEDTWL